MGKKVRKGIDDFATLYPKLLKAWDFDKNGDLDPSDFYPGSNKKVWWKCEKGHSFERQIYWMTHNPDSINCPVCHNQIIVPGVNDLATTHPELMEEWDFDKNVVKPTEVHSSTNMKVWWKCKKYGHSWDAQIYSRAVMKLGCPICSNQRLLVGFNDLETLYPEITKYWNYDKNEKTPKDYIGTQSNKRVWFKCEQGHEYESAISDFTNGKRCPVCANKKVVTGINDLATTHPSLVDEWDYEKNDELSPEMFTYGSDIKVWWKCKKGHSWKASINSRVRGNGCPICAKESQVSLPEKALYFYLSKHFKDIEENYHPEGFGKYELDIYIPSLKLAIEYDGCNWHKTIENDLKKDELCLKNDIRLIRIREEGCKDYESESIKIYCPRTHSNIVLLSKTIEEMFNKINSLYGLSIEPIISIENDLTAINELLMTYEKRNSLASMAPHLLKEWDYEKNGSITPDMIAYRSNKKVWWKCEKGHSWSAIVNSRVKGNGCPFCSNRFVSKGENDLATLYPEIAAEWDYEKNGDLTPDNVLSGSNKAVWWKCKHGHSWRIAVVVRTRMGHGCPVCAGQKPIPGVNDLATLYPEIAAEWDYEKNGDLKPSDILPGSEKTIWWKCDKGHSYSAFPRSRTVLKTGCPVCQNKKIQPGYNDLETLHPELANEWNYEKNEGLLPSQVGGNGGSHRKVWWKCNECGHEWQATLASRISLRTGCPSCYRAKKKANIKKEVDDENK